MNISKFKNDLFLHLKKQLHIFLIHRFMKDIGLKDKSSYKIRDDMSIDVRHNFYLKTILFEELPVQFNIINGSFSIDDTNDENCLKSMKGFPKIINGNFKCNNQKIKNLQFGPEIVKGDYDVSRNNINDLTWKPNEVYGILDFSNNDISDFKPIEIFYLKSFKYRRSKDIRDRIIKKGNPVGRRYSEIDPYGEENWDD